MNTTHNTRTIEKTQKPTIQRFRGKMNGKARSEKTGDLQPGREGGRTSIIIREKGESQGNDTSHYKPHTKKQSPGRDEDPIGGKKGGGRKKKQRDITFGNGLQHRGGK